VAGPGLIKRAFDPVAQLDDLEGHWTSVTPDARISAEEGQRFFRKLAELAARVDAAEDLAPTAAVFKLIGNCRHFVYLVRNNIFHGSKSLGEIYERDQARRLEVYDSFLKCLVSLFFLSVDREPVAADFMQLPVRVPIQGGNSCTIGTSAVSNYVATRSMKPEDSRLIRSFFERNPVPAELPTEQAALFYPSAGDDVITPMILGLPYCSRFFFYDRRWRRGEQQVRHERAVRIRIRISAILGIDRRGIAQNDQQDENILTFEVGGVLRTVHLVHRENREFLNRKVDLAFYFHRGDSEGEGGSGQEWDGRFILELGEMAPAAGSCMVVTDGEPGGLHCDLRQRLEPVVRIPSSHRGRDYYQGAVPGEFLQHLS